jgi:hypothetical protein
VSDPFPTSEEFPRRYGWLAAGFDVLVGNIVLGFALALSTAVRKQAAPLESLWIGLPVLAVGVVAYHLWIADRIDFLSPGERLAGRAHALRGKIWHTAYDRSRWPLFAVVVVSLAMAPHAWHRLWTGAVLSTTEVLVGLVVVVLLVSGALSACGGSREAIVWLCVYHLLVGAMKYRAWGGLGQPWDVVRDTASVRIVLAVVCLGLAFWYRPRSAPGR